MAKQPELKKWWTHFPFREKSYVIYCFWGPEKVLVQIFAAEYACKKFLEALLKDDRIVWERRTECRTEKGVVIKFKELEEILDYEYGPGEEEWELPPEYVECVRNFKFGVYVNKKLVVPEEHQLKKRRIPQEDPSDEAPKVKATLPPPRKVERKGKEGLTTAAALADQLKVTARQFRGALRSAKIEKPEGGWAWTNDEAQKIVEKVKKYLGK